MRHCSIGRTSLAGHVVLSTSMQVSFRSKKYVHIIYVGDWIKINVLVCVHSHPSASLEESHSLDIWKLTPLSPVFQK